MGSAIAGAVVEFVGACAAVGFVANAINKQAAASEKDRIGLKASLSTAVEVQVVVRA